MKVVNLVSRIIIGVVFIFSGFVKVIDPLGSVYKFNDYFNLAFGIPWMTKFSLFLAVSMSAIEFLIGFAVLFGLKTRLASWGSLLFMLFFTPLTLYIAIANPVSDCGCFGDALILSNTNTFIKNIFILAAAVVVFIYRKRFKTPLSEKLQWGLIVLASVLILGLSIYCYRHEPIIDFRPWKVGNKIQELVTPTSEVAEITLLYKNKITGEVKEYPVDNYPWNDSVWVSQNEFVDQKKNVIQEFKKAPISDFVILDDLGDDLTEGIMSNPEFNFLLFAYDLPKTNIKSFKKINKFSEEAQSEDYLFIGLTASPFSFVEEFRHEHQCLYPFYQVDEIALKTAIRSNPGLILLKDGVVIAKWGHRDLPEYEVVKKKYMQAN